jgi:hypothetical protein
MQISVTDYRMTSRMRLACGFFKHQNLKNGKTQTVLPDFGFKAMVNTANQIKLLG